MFFLSLDKKNGLLDLGKTIHLNFSENLAAPLVLSPDQDKEHRAILVHKFFKGKLSSVTDIIKEIDPNAKLSF